MARLLIGPTALAELKAIASRAVRRRVVARLGGLGSVSPRERVAGEGRSRHRVAGRRILYRRRPDGAVVVVAVLADALD
jgi:hypothetical protein